MPGWAQALEKVSAQMEAAVAHPSQYYEFLPPLPKLLEAALALEKAVQPRCHATHLPSLEEGCPLRQPLAAVLWLALVMEPVLKQVPAQVPARAQKAQLAEAVPEVLMGERPQQSWSVLPV